MLLNEVYIVQIARKKSEAPRFIAGSLKDDSIVGKLPGLECRGVCGEVLPAKGPARAPWPTLSLQVSILSFCLPSKHQGDPSEHCCDAGQGARQDRAGPACQLH